MVVKERGGRIKDRKRGRRPANGQDGRRASLAASRSRSGRGEPFYTGTRHYGETAGGAGDAFSDTVSSFYYLNLFERMDSPLAGPSPARPGTF